MDHNDYYDVLGVDRDASQQAIKEAYRKLAFQYHPDRNTEDPAATEKMQNINEAYAVLSDVSKRREYELLRSRYGPSAYERFRQSHTTDDIFRGSDIDQIFEEFARTFGFRNSSDIFMGSYGPEYRSFDFQRAGMFGRGFVFYPGVRRGVGQQQAQDSRVQMPELAIPGITGKLIKLFLRATGIELPERGKDRHDMVKISSEEARDGTEIEYSYKRWDKAGNLMVKIPVGVKDGQRIRLGGKGSPGKAGGAPGDLYLRVRIRKSLAQRLTHLFKI